MPEGKFGVSFPKFCKERDKMQFLRVTEQQNLINVPSEIRACPMEKYLKYNIRAALVPGAVLIPLRIATKLSMTKSESILEN